MTILSWNCRGLGNILAVQVLRELVRTHKVDFIFLFKILCHFNRVEEVRRKLGFDGSFSVEKEGRSGGVCVFEAPKFLQCMFYFETSSFSFITCIFSISLDPNTHIINTY